MARNGEIRMSRTATCDNCGQPIIEGQALRTRIGLICNNCRMGSHTIKVEGKGRNAINLNGINQFKYVQLIDVSRKGDAGLTNLLDAVNFLADNGWTVHSYVIQKPSADFTAGFCLMEKIKIQ